MAATAGYGYAPNPELPHTFMATAFDLGEPRGAICLAGCIHPSNKQATGHRLAVAARNQVYNDHLVTWSGPRVSRVFLRAVPDTIAVVYSGPGTDFPSRGIKLRGTYGFEVCAEGCDVRVPGGNIYNPVSRTGWAPATADGIWLSTVQVRYDVSLFEKHITRLRYGYDDTPNVFYGTGPAVFNHEGLPATPGVYDIVYQGEVPVGSEDAGALAQSESGDRVELTDAQRRDAVLQHRKLLRDGARSDDASRHEHEVAPLVL